MEWFERGYYQKSAPDVAKQFLVDSMFTLEDMKNFPLAKVEVPAGDTSGFRVSMDTISGCKDFPLIRTVSLEEFSDIKIDVIMATLSDNQEPWAKLRRDLKPAAKLLREEGNVRGWSSLHKDYKNLLTSDLPTFQRAGTPNKVLYHQRFDTENVFTYSEPTRFDRVTCFMPGFRGVPDLVYFAERHNFGGMEFLDYGHHSKLGFLTPKRRFSEEMRNTSFVWHVKPGGDGFGHVIHNSMAMGRPVITIADDYINTIAWPLLLDERTCILIGKNPVENSEKIKALATPEKITRMGRAASNLFKCIVDYEWEEKEISRFLENLR